MILRQLTAKDRRIRPPSDQQIVQQRSVQPDILLLQLLLPQGLQAQQGCRIVQHDHLAFLQAGFRALYAQKQLRPGSVRFCRQNIK